MPTTTMTAANHDETVSDGIVLIDFWAEWCGPCRQFAPVYEKVSERHLDVTFAKVDTEAERELAAAYGIQSIPTLVIYRDGVPLFGQPGALPEQVLEDLLSQTRNLDMDEVRAKIAAEQAERNGVASD